jgi:nitrite reductase/ring-hydroxylating ferredoxin subunit
MPMLLRVARVDEIPPGTCRKVKLRGIPVPFARLGSTPVLVCNAGGEFHAIGAKCPHMGLPLDKGDFDGTHVTCRYHGARVDVRTGTLASPPNRAEWAKGSFFRRIATLFGRLKRPKEGCGHYRTEVRGNHVYVALDSERQVAPASIQQNDRKPAVVGR